MKLYFLFFVVFIAAISALKEKSFEDLIKDARLLLKSIEAQECTCPPPDSGNNPSPAPPDSLPPPPPSDYNPPPPDDGNSGRNTPAPDGTTPPPPPDYNQPPPPDDGNGNGGCPYDNSRPTPPAPQPGPPEPTPTPEPAPEPTPEPSPNPSPPSPEPTPEPTPTPTPSPPNPSPNPSPVPSGSSKFAQSLLDIHNKYRAIHGTPPLTWDVDLQKRAQVNSDKCVFGHDAGNQKEDPFGQNIAGVNPPSLGYGGTTDFSKCIPQEVANDTLNMWYGIGQQDNECNNYDYNKGECKGGSCMHFTQVIWNGTTKVGCGVSDCRKKLNYVYVVCNYSPPGNYGGQFKENVPPPVK